MFLHFSFCKKALGLLNRKWKASLSRMCSPDSFEETVRNKIHFKHWQILNVYKLRTEQVLSMVEIGKLYYSDRYIYSPFPWYCQSQGPIILICVFVNRSTNPSPRARSWPRYLHESASWLVFTTLQLVFIALRRSRSSLVEKNQENLWDQGSSLIWHSLPFL